MSNHQNRIGIYLYLESAAHEKVAAYLQDWQPSSYWGRIQGVRVTHSVVSSLIPKALQEGATSWLVLYRANLPQQLLVLPFPESDNITILDDPEDFGRSLSSLLEYVHGGNYDTYRNSDWYPYNGFRNLTGYIKRKKKYPDPVLPQRFQVIQHHKPLEELLKKPEIHLYDEEHRETVTVFTRASQRIQQSRDELLTLLLTARHEEQIQEMLQDFEASLLEESSRLSEAIDKKIPTIIKAFESVLDDETKIFLISAETVARFARRQLSDDFDFSLCGCGLWKAVERELNSSLIWYLRFVKGVADKDRKPVVGMSRAGVNYEAGSKTVNIDRRERGSMEFEGITLGYIKYLLRSARDNNIAEEVRPALETKTELLQFVFESGKGGLAHFIGQVANIRNGHAHIKAMNENAYQELHAVILDPDGKPAESLLGKILEMKRAIVVWVNACATASSHSSHVRAPTHTPADSHRTPVPPARGDCCAP